MNNFNKNSTKTESLPKSGHVNEVCKEWLVREDGALAYKLQSQEITDFYKGNRYRNAVVREDFPTALHEQIKEVENADKQTEAYRRQLMEQEEHDKRVAKEIADKLERDLQEQQQRELYESETVAKQMQEIYVNLPPPAPAPLSRDKNRPPPRPAKGSTLQNLSETATTSSSRFQQQQQQLPQYAHGNGFSVELPTTPTQREQQQQQQTRTRATAQAQQQAHQFVKLSPEKYDQLVGNEPIANNSAAAERHMQQHADDIELYVDPCDYASLREIGLPMDELKEMSKKLKQEQKDELLARRLQELEVNDGLTQEERDRMMAIEAQDKELAKMLQEREKAKAKRAKEKARLRKSQQQKDCNSSTFCSTSNGLHCGPLLPLPQDCMSSSTKHHSAHSTAGSVKEETLVDPLELEAYSNPIDVIHQQQQQARTSHSSNGNGTLTNGSLNRDGRHGTVLHNRDDDIYTLPVDSCRLGQRPNSLHIGAAENGAQVTAHNSMTRSENYSYDLHDTLRSGHDVAPATRMNYSKSDSFDQSSSPTPPYMPIQGTRRSNSSDDRKKKSKDKCTHQ